MERVLKVTGTGKASAESDAAMIRISVRTADKTSNKALAQNNSITNETVALLKKRGIADTDVKTSHFGVVPVFERDKQHMFKQPRRITHWEVVNEMSISTGDMEGLGSLLSELTDIGNAINGISFYKRNLSEIEDQMRKRAVINAKEKAEIYASEGNFKVGRILSLSESSTIAYPVAERGFAAQAAAYGGDVDVSGGMCEHSATIDVVFEIVDTEG